MWYWNIALEYCSWNIASHTRLRDKSAAHTDHMGAPLNQLSSKDAASISERLCILDLRLPGQLTRGEPPTKAMKQAYLMGLLSHDPGVFLERHGELLTTDELQSFDSLRWVAALTTAAAGRRRRSGCPTER